MVAPIKVYQQLSGVTSEQFAVVTNPRLIVQGDDGVIRDRSGTALIGIGAAAVYTWGTLPTPGAYIGTAFVSDVGPHGSLWRSNGATWGLVNGSCILADYGSTVGAVTGTTAETTLFTYNLPANLLGLSGHLKMRMKLSHTSNVNGKTMRVRVNGTAALGMGPAANTATSEMWFEMQNRGATNSQLASNGTMNPGSGSGSSANAWTLLTQDSTAMLPITFTTALAVSTDTVTVEAMMLELVRP